MSSDVRNIKGFQARGGELPWISPMEIRIVGLDIDATAENWFAHCPRADEEVDEEFLQSVRDDGIRQAIDVYKDGSFVNVLEGRRRVKGARIVWEEQKANRVSEDKSVAVRVNIRKGSPEELFRYNARSHQGRKDLNPIQRAEVILNYAKHCSDDPAKAAATFGCSVATIKSDLALLDLAAPVQKAVSTYKLSKNNATRLASLPRAEQVAKLDEYLAGNAPAEAGDTTAEQRERAEGETPARTTAPRRRIDNGGPTPPPKKTVDRARVYLEGIDRPSETAKIVRDVLIWIGGGEPKTPQVKKVLEEASES